MLGQVALVLPDVYVVELGLVAGLNLYLLRNLSAGVDPVAFQASENGFEAALLGLEAALQGLDHISMGWRIGEMHVERGRIGSAGLNQATLPAPELHAALVVRVENPHDAHAPPLKAL